MPSLRSPRFLALVHACLSAALFTLIAAQPTPAAGEPKIMCTLVNTELYASEGWHPITSDESQRIKAMREAGKAEVGFLPGSLICTQWRDGTAESVSAGLWYWRRRPAAQ